MSLANKVASAARSVVENARKTADQALHDREALRKKIGDQVRDLPVTAVQYTVKGVGQALLVGDRVRQEIGRRVGRGGDGDGVAPAERHQTGAPEAPAKSAFEEAAERPQAVRPARKARSAKGGVGPAPAAQESAASVEASLPAAAAEATAPAERPAPEAELPISEYDERTLPSLRAKMKGLTVEDLRQLIEYEKTHAARADVISMFERRIAKLESE